MAHSQTALSKHWLSLPVSGRLAIAAAFGIGAGIASGMYVAWLYAPLVTWDVTALIASVTLWRSVRHLGAADTKKHATNDDPSRGVVDMIMLLVSFASLAAVLVLIVKANSSTGLREALDIGLGVASVVISWTLVHLIYMLRYADLYFSEGNAIDFNSDAEPTYQDFAYLAFTIGMTYQVSDTALKTAELRKTARQHALISYVFGTAIIATVINTIAGLGK